MKAEKLKDDTVKSFHYTFPTCKSPDLKFHVEIPVEIPFPGSIGELVQRVLLMFHIPVYLEEDLNEKLAQFVAEETSNFNNDRNEELIKQFKSGSVDVDNIIKSLEKSYRENVIEFAEHKGTSDEEVFAAAYHRLVHSPALETILQVENSYANTVEHALNTRNSDIEEITKRQTEEMEDKVRLLNTKTTEEEINNLAGKHFEEQSLVAGRWGSQIDALCQAQKAEYRTWLMQTLEEHQTNSALNTPSNSPLGIFSPNTDGLITSVPASLPPSNNAMDESFTIHLGSQLKQMHNVRICARHALDLCKNPSTDNGADLTGRLQTALGLYSSELCGVVLLAESPPSRPSGLTQKFVKVAHSSTDYHFPTVDDQLQRISECIKEPIEKRNEHRLKDQNLDPSLKRCKDSKNLTTGDIFITKHSNLAKVHVVFHMIADEASLRSGDVNSRHPAILGLRNILKAACQNDVTTLSIPVLLRHDMAEEMTVSWCVKRAELVLKCVKGFMMETASWGGAELANIDFLVPEGISHEVFSALAALLPTIFRLSNPLKFNANSSK